jgi:hypothetical protein
LALKIVLLKVHLLESRDDEEQRAFEKAQEKAEAEARKQAQNKHDLQHEKKSRAADSKPLTKPQLVPNERKQAPPTRNSAPAGNDLLDEMSDLSQARGVDEPALLNLIVHGYRHERLDNLPIWLVEEIIDLLSDEKAGPSTVEEKIDELQKRRKLASGKIGTDPGEFVLPFGKETKGKKVKDLNEGTLKKILQWTDKELKKVPKVEGAAGILEAQSKIKGFLKSVGVE